MKWNVSVWVSDATRPVTSEDWPTKHAAETRANALREQIKRSGWTHRVLVSPVVNQS